MTRDDTEASRLGDLGFDPSLIGIGCMSLSKPLNLFSPQSLYLKIKELGLDNL